MAASKIETRVLQVLQSTSDQEYQTQFLTKNSAFSRIESQKMSFEEMTLFMIANTGNSLSFELLEFFNNAQNIENVITKQAFSKQRQYIQNELFQDLSCRYVHAVYQERRKLFHGHLLVAVDGSTAEIPNTKKLRDHFGCAKASATSASNARIGLNDFYGKPGFSHGNVSRFPPLFSV